MGWAEGKLLDAILVGTVKSRNGEATQYEVNQLAYAELAHMHNLRYTKMHNLGRALLYFIAKQVSGGNAAQSELNVLYRHREAKLRKEGLRLR